MSQGDTYRSLLQRLDYALTLLEESEKLARKGRPREAGELREEALAELQRIVGELEALTFRLAMLDLREKLEKLGVAGIERRRD